MRAENRIDHIDIAKAIAIFMVVLGHTVSGDTTIKTVLYSFHMPTFFILAGMVIRKRENFSIRAFVKKKAFKLLIPYFIWGAVYAQFSIKNCVYILYGTREALLRAGSLSSLWYLPVLFISIVIAQSVVQFADNKWAQTVIAALLFAAGFHFPHFSIGDPWGVDIAFAAAGFVLSGYLLAPEMNNRTALLLPIYLIALFFGIKFNNSSLGYVLMANAVYGNPWLFLIGSFAGTGLVLSLAFLIEYIPAKKAVINIGRSTLGIFLLHKPIVECFTDVCRKISLNYNNVFVAITIALISLLIAYALTLVIRMIIPAALGEQEEKSCKA